MRPYLAIALFALAVVAAACGGGGGSGTTPTVPTAAPNQTPLHYTSAKLSLKIPAQPVTPAIKRPAYVSPNTQSVQIFVAPVLTTGASPSAPPAPQTFAVTTPSPCTQNPDGSKSCTFNVQAPYGQDQFVVKTFAVANPNASSVPLSVFTSGTVNVSANGTPPPLDFTLTGQVASVRVAMQSPDPSITPSTQIGTIGSAITSSQLLLTPEDASGAPIMTDTFAQPVTVNVTPANAGVSLMLTSTSQCTPASTASGTSASITCASDLNKLAFAYNGAIVYSSGAPIDHVAFQALPQPNGSPAPAFLALGGTTLSYNLPAGTLGSLDTAQFVKNSSASQTYTYLLEGGGTSVLGQVDLTNPSATTSVTNLGYEGWSVTVDHNGNIWVAQPFADTIDCYPSISASPVPISPVVPGASPQPIAPWYVTTDTQGNVWYYGSDPFGNGQTGYIPSSASCNAAPPTVNPVAQAGTDSPVGLQASQAGGVIVLGQNNIYTATTSSSGSLTPVSLGGYGAGLNVDASGNAYTGLTSEGLGSGLALLPQNQSAFTSSLTLLNAGDPVGVGVNQTGIASTLVYADYTQDLLAVGSAASFSNFAVFAQGGGCYAAFVDSNGDAWGFCWVYDTTTQAYDAQLTHIVRTSVWNALIPSAPQVSTGYTLFVPVLESGYKGPFNVTVSDPTAISTSAPLTGYENTIPLTFSASGSSPVTVTVTDAFGRSQTTSVGWRVASVRRRNVKPHVRQLPRRGIP
ncbi:MAG: hypothetical protein JO322_00445 [Candidatus Eremiobacteraeota bacterium]|nr:hypothetical protein [Candidatus Eremiobacteraeota bacterium]